MKIKGALFKTVLGLVCFSLLILSAVPVQVAAEDKPRISLTVSNASGKKGELVEISVMLSGISGVSEVSGISGGQIELSYDRRIVEQVRDADIKKGELLANGFMVYTNPNLTDHSLKLVWAGTGLTKKDGALFTVTFKLAQSGVGEVKIVDLVLKDQDVLSIPQDLLMIGKGWITSAQDDPPGNLPDIPDEPDTPDEPDIIEETDASGMPKEPDAPGIPKIPVTGISLKDSEIFLKVGESCRLLVDITPPNATNKRLNWHSDATNIAKVGVDGTVTAVAPGETTVSVTTVDGNLTAACKVVVEREAEEIIQPIKLDPTRLSGRNRYMTAVEISKEGWLESDTVILARGMEFADALAAAPLSKALGAPILLTPTKQLHEEVLQEILRLKAEKVLIIGSEEAISKRVQEQLEEQGLVTERIIGEGSSDTSVKIGQKLTNIKSAFIVNDSSYADALSIASYAAAKGVPILLTPSDRLSDEIKGYIQENEIEDIYIIGGESAISISIEEELVKIAQNVVRLGGKNRYETNTMILDYFLDEIDFGSIYLATGPGFADALAGAPLAAKTNSPILLVNPKDASNLLKYLNSHREEIENGFILGGEQAVKVESIDQLFE